MYDNLTQLTTLNPVLIDFSNSLPYTRFVDKYPPETFLCRFRVTGVTISTSMENMDREILVICTCLNDCKKADINRTREDPGNNTYRKNSKLNTIEKHIQLDKHDLVDYLNIQEPGNTLISFLTESIRNISKFDISLKNKNRGLIRFGEDKQKVLQFNFAIGAINA